MSLPGTDTEVAVVDTDVISFVLKHDRVRSPRYARHLADRRVVVPFSAVAELSLWAEVRNWRPARRADLEHFFQGCLIHFPDYLMCSRWALLVAHLRRAGRQIGTHDAWMAATAVYLDAPLLTHN